MGNFTIIPMQLLRLALWVLMSNSRIIHCCLHCCRRRLFFENLIRNSYHGRSSLFFIRYSASFLPASRMPDKSRLDFPLTSFHLYTLPSLSKQCSHFRCGNWALGLIPLVLLFRSLPIRSWTFCFLLRSFFTLICLFFFPFSCHLTENNTSIF